MAGVAEDSHHVGGGDHGGGNHHNIFRAGDILKPFNVSKLGWWLQSLLFLMPLDLGPCLHSPARGVCTLIGVNVFGFCHSCIVGH